MQNLDHIRLQHAQETDPLRAARAAMIPEWLATTSADSAAARHASVPTATISAALYRLGDDIDSPDGVAQALLHQAAERLDAQTVTISALRDAAACPQDSIAELVTGCALALDYIAKVNGIATAWEPNIDGALIASHLASALRPHTTAAGRQRNDHIANAAVALANAGRLLDGPAIPAPRTAQEGIPK